MIEEADWPEPVVVEHKVPDRPTIIWSTSEAANCLVEDWPTKDGEEYHNAMRTFMLVLDGRGEPNDAREAFKAAVHEAGFSIRE